MDVLQENNEEILTEQFNHLTTNLAPQFLILNNYSLDRISQETTWSKKKDLIEKIDSIKSSLFENYLKSTYENYFDKSIDFEIFQNSNKIKELKEIITQCDVNQWNEEINNLSIYLFIIKLFYLYNFDFNILHRQYCFIEELLNKNHDDDNINLNNLWQSKIKEESTSMEIIDYIILNILQKHLINMIYKQVSIV